MSTIEQTTTLATNPYAETIRDIKAANHHGANSLQVFSSVTGLSHTHADADGFQRYLDRFNPSNFRFKDAGVQYWEYTEPYDDWQGVYGGDAVGVFYHSGHGGMDGNGVFYAPLGAVWSGQDQVNSTQMQLGNERLRYLFWSTCYSLRVHDGQTPVRTWNNANKGLRMIFGWETTSWDSDIYGSRFWDHWNAGNSFSKAWLVAGWDAGHDQAPSACAMGASAGEAQDRVFHERLLDFRPASNAWYWWTWYDAAKAAVPQPATASSAVPGEAYVLQFDDVPSMAGALNAVGPTTIVHPGLARVGLSDESLGAMRADRPLSRAAVLTAAAEVRNALDLDGIELQPHLVREQRAAGAARDGSEQVESHVAGYAVEYRQVIDGVPVISDHSGYLRVHLGADGTPTSADLTARPVRSSTPQPIVAPPAADAADSGGRGDLGAAFAAAAAATPGLAGAREIEDSRRVGYVVEGNTAYLGAQTGYLARFDDLISKKIRVTVPLNH